MDMLIKKARIIDANSSFNGKQVDILISKGKIAQIAKIISQKVVQVIEQEDLYVSVGWMDVGVQTGDPGYEHREDLKSVTTAAAAGGYTSIACYPNTNPVMDSKSGVLYLQNNSRDLLVDCWPIAAVSEGCGGQDITEMMDMQQVGAIAFSDGKKAIQHAGLMKRALLYVKAFDGLIMNRSHDLSLSGEGQINEGSVSLSMGLSGIPRLAEKLMVQRDIELLDYTQSRLHISNISTADSVEVVRRAKAKGLQVTASVAAVNLLLDDSELIDFDTNFKVMPPLRSLQDIEALKEGLKDGTIDFISSHHVPLEEEVKKLEFPYAKFGAIGLETAFAIANTSLNGLFPLSDLIAKISTNPRKILNLPELSIEEGQEANLTLFLPNQKWKVSEKDLFSRSKNTPFIGRELIGKVVGIINGKKVFGV